MPQKTNIKVTVDARNRLLGKKVQFKRQNASDTIHLLADISDVFSESQMKELIETLPKSIGAILKANGDINPQLSKLQREKLRGVLDEFDK
jgi:hypothetical protein